MKFKYGDELILIEHYGLAAEKGARAICQGYDREYIKVKWIRDGRDHNQANGGYNEEEFVLAKTKKIKSKLFGIAKWCNKYYKKR